MTSDPLDVLRAKSRRDVTLEGGDTVTVRRVSMMDAVILAEDTVPAPVLSALMAEDTPEADAAPEPAEAMAATIRKTRKRQKDIVRACVVAVNGKAVTIPEDAELAELFTDTDIRNIADTALWVDAEGKG